MRTVVLLSGGIDSAVLLADLLTQHHDCVGIGFDYGQLCAGQELSASLRIADHYRTKYVHCCINDAACFAPNALTGETEMPAGHADAPDATCVPGRNLVLLALAHSFALANNAHQLAFGAIIDGRAGYADCRPDFIEAADMAITESSRDRTPLHLHAPFQSWTKAEVVRLGMKLRVPLDLTWSCYAAGDQPCGTCGGCDQRLTGLAGAGCTL